MLSSEFNILPITLFQEVRFEKLLHKQGSFFQMIILSTDNPLSSSKLNALPHNSVPSGQNCKTFLHKQVSLFSDDHFEYQNPMFSVKLNVLLHNCVPSCQI